MASAASGDASTNGVMVNGHAAMGETKIPLPGAAEALEPTQSKWVRSPLQKILLQTAKSDLPK